ncbi:MAG TPA: four helix bundle protein [Candidatus Woesebacteria bacterium]|nr:four helix bundle protein [Candidatus Woesebacteria bacterium]
MKENIIQIKSFQFAVRIIKLYIHLSKTKKEFVLSKQILRSGTSIGANVEEAIGAQSKNDFVSKLSIAYKESRETKYWLRLLNETNFITKKEFDSIINDLEEILRILGKIQKTSKNS